MNASLWKRAADFITQQSARQQDVKPTATADSQQLVITIKPTFSG